MIEIVYSRRFLKSVKHLPLAQQKKLANLLVIFQEDPYHPFLHSKQLTGSLAGLLSFRITRDWRVIFQFLNPDKIQMLRAAHRKDIYY